MGRLFDEIRAAVLDDRYLISEHADERCEERGISDWQVVAGIEDAILLDERAGSLPNPSVVVRQLLIDGGEVEAVWSWLPRSRRAKLVTVYFPEAFP